MIKALYIKISVATLSIILGVVAIYFYKKNTEELNRAILNYKAEALQNSSVLDNERRMYQLTIAELQYSKDSIISSLLKTVDSLKIKNKKLSQLQYMRSAFSKKDTLILSDTVFIQGTRVDTTISDKWYSVNVKLSYPDTIQVSPSFISEKHVIIHTSRETLNPPKKFFLFRWFQKKHTVVKVKVIEKSPYIKGGENKFIEVVK